MGYKWLQVLVRNKKETANFRFLKLFQSPSLVTNDEIDTETSCQNQFMIEGMHR